MDIRISEVYIILLVIISGCGPKPGAERPECFDGEGIRYTMDCGSKEWVNDGQHAKAGGGLQVGDWASIKGNAETESIAIREISDELQSYAVKWARLCQDYNSCAISKDTYVEENRKLRAVLDERGFQKFHQAILMARNPEKKRRLIADAYEAIVPGERRKELYLEFSVLAGSTPESLAPIRNGANLHTNDRMAFIIRPSNEAYIYLMQQTASGEISVIFPDDRISIKNPVAAGQSVRIPDQGLFRVNEKDLGTEKVFIVASLNPITDARQSIETLSKVGSFAPSLATEDESSNSEGQANASGNGCKTRALELGSPLPECVRTRGIEVEASSIHFPLGNSGPEPSPSMRLKTEAADTTIVQIFQFEHLE